MLYQNKTLLECGYNSLFYTHIDNGLWDIATVTMQYWNPEFDTKSCTHGHGNYMTLLLICNVFADH